MAVLKNPKIIKAPIKTIKRKLNKFRKKKEEIDQTPWIKMDLKRNQKLPKFMSSPHYIRKIFSRKYSSLPLEINYLF